MKVISRIPTKAQYSYLELQGELEEFLSLTKEKLQEIIKKHEGGITIYNIETANNPLEKFEAELN